MLVGLYQMVKCIRCDGSCTRGSRLLTHDCCGHGLRYYTTSHFLLDEILANLACELRYLAARLLYEILANLACEVRY